MGWVKSRTAIIDKEIRLDKPCRPCSDLLTSYENTRYSFSEIKFHHLQAEVPSQQKVGFQCCFFATMLLRIPTIFLIQATAPTILLCQLKAGVDNVNG
jgi:hypothetical protein